MSTKLRPLTKTEKAIGLSTNLGVAILFARFFSSIASSIYDSTEVPWFWITFLFFFWAFSRDTLKGFVLEKEPDTSYPFQAAWEVLEHMFFQVLVCISFWVLLARTKTSFIVLGNFICLGLASVATHNWLLRTYRQKKPKGEPASRGERRRKN